MKENHEYYDLGHAEGVEDVESIDEDTLPPGTKAKIAEFLGDVGYQIARTLLEKQRGTLCLSLDVGESGEVTELFFSHVNTKPAHMMAMIVAIANLIRGVKDQNDPDTCHCEHCRHMFIAASMVSKIASGEAKPIIVSTDGGEPPTFH